MLVCGITSQVHTYNSIWKLGTEYSTNESEEAEISVSYKFVKAYKTFFPNGIWI